MIAYNTVLENWHDGTGGGLDLSTEFEGWSNEKLDKNHVDVDNCDHTDVSNILAILISGYCK